MTAPGPHNHPTPGNAPVTDHEADALDTWLASITATFRRDDPQWSPETRGGRRASNGHVDPATSLQSTAEAFHARLARAEHEAEPDVPADAIWEKIMASTTTIAVPQAPRRAAELVSAPSADRQPTIPGWLSGSHWLISAVMIAAVVVGIVALYSSFAGSPGPDDDAATNPNFAMASPGQTTPSVDAAWLQPYSPDECDVEPRTLDEAAAFMQDPGETVPHQYGPVQPVSNEQALEIASANRVFQSCSLTGDTEHLRAMVSPRLIFEGKGSAYFDSITNRSATYEEFVANHRELSKLLLSDPERDYTVESTQSIPLREDGLPDYSASEIFWSVMLPNDLVMLPDGRIGGPESTLLPANHEEFQPAIEEVRLATPTLLDYDMVNFHIYVQDPTQNGQWVLDEQFVLCISGCDAFYADAEEFYQSNVPALPATPSATPAKSTPSASTDWLAPIAPGECDIAETRALREVGAIVQDPGEIVPREYSPVTGVEAPLAQEIAGASRAWESCRAQGLIGERRAVESLRYIAEVQPYDVLSPSSAGTFEDWVALNETTRTQFLDPDTESYRVESDALPAYDCETGYGETDLSAQVSYEVIQPQHLVQLPDGRIGGPVTSLVGPGFLQCLEENPPAFGSAHQGTSIHIYVQDPTRDNRWALDERFGICVSGCDAYYEEYAFLYPPFPAPPEAATPVAGIAPVQPITPEECDVEALSDDEVSAITQGAGTEIERSYEPLGPVDAALAGDVAGADRTWQSCFVYGSAGQRAALRV